MSCPDFDKGHAVMAIYYRGKPDSLDLKCYCGHMVTWAEWHGKNVPDWQLTPALVTSFVAFLRAFHEGTTRIYPEWDE